MHALADLQIGSESCNEKLIKRRVEEICSDPHAMVVIAGDIEDNDRPSTRAMRAKTFADRPEVLSNDAKKHLSWIDHEVLPILKPLTKMPIGIIGVVAGHHWTQLTPDMNSVQYICNRLSAMGKNKVPYLGIMSSWIYLRFRGKGKLNGHAATRLIHLQHGTGGGQTLASALTRLERTAQGFPADVYIRAHDCKLIGAKTVEVFPKDTEGEPELLSKDIVLLNVGAATRGYNLTLGPIDYVEQEMMRPTAMGWGCVHFDVRRAYKDEDSKRGALHVETKLEF